MCLKLDLTEAFDSVSWCLLETAMAHLSFPRTLITWVMECVKSPTFSALVNG